MPKGWILENCILFYFYTFIQYKTQNSNIQKDDLLENNIIIVIQLFLKGFSTTQNNTNQKPIKNKIKLSRKTMNFLTFDIAQNDINLVVHNFLKEMSTTQNNTNQKPIKNK